MAVMSLLASGLIIVVNSLILALPYGEEFFPDCGTNY
jgi:hypothetical protein